MVPFNEPIALYAQKRDGQFYLSDENTIKGRSINWINRKIKLATSNQNDSSCEISGPNSFIKFFTYEKYAQINEDSSPKAVVSPDGSVVLKNVPLNQTTTKKKKETPKPKLNPLKFP